MKTGSIDVNFQEGILYVDHNKPLEREDYWIYSSTCFFGINIDGLCWKQNAFLLLRCLENYLSLSFISFVPCKDKANKKDLWYFKQNTSPTLTRGPELRGLWRIAQRGQAAWGCYSAIAVSRWWTSLVPQSPFPLPPATCLASTGDSILLKVCK